MWKPGVAEVDAATFFTTGVHCFWVYCPRILSAVSQYQTRLVDIVMHEFFCSAGVVKQGDLCSLADLGRGVLVSLLKQIKDAA